MQTNNTIINKCNLVVIPSSVYYGIQLGTSTILTLAQNTTITNTNITLNVNSSNTSNPIAINALQGIGAILDKITVSVNTVEGAIANAALVVGGDNVQIIFFGLTLSNSIFIGPFANVITFAFATLCNVNNNNLSFADTGIKITNSTGITLANNDIQNNENSAIIVQPASSSCNIINNTIRLNGATAIDLQGNGNLVRNNNIYDNGTGVNDTGSNNLVTPDNVIFNNPAPMAVKARVRYNLPKLISKK